jgi:hypothetical protein
VLCGIRCGDVVALNVPAEIDPRAEALLASLASHLRIVRVAFGFGQSQFSLLTPALSASILHALAISTIVLSHHSPIVIQRTLNKCQNRVSLVVGSNGLCGTKVASYY